MLKKLTHSPLEGLFRKIKYWAEFIMADLQMSENLQVTIENNWMTASWLFYSEYPIELDFEDMAWIIIKLDSYLRLYKKAIKNKEDVNISYFDESGEEIVLIKLHFNEAASFFEKFCTAAEKYISEKENIKKIVKIIPKIL